MSDVKPRCGRAAQHDRVPSGSGAPPEAEDNERAFRAQRLSRQPFTEQL
jgi:hypothetical protein